MPVVVGLLLVLAVRALFGIVTEIVAVRPVLKAWTSIYVLSTLALALMVQQFTAIEWGTESRPFPRLFDIAHGELDQQFWLPMLACASLIVSLSCSIVISSSAGPFWRSPRTPMPARARPTARRGLRMASYALRGMMGAARGFAAARCCLPSLAMPRC